MILRTRQESGIGYLPVIVLTLLASTWADARPREDIIFRGAAIYTMDAKRPWATALGISRGRIIYVGDDKKVAHYRSRNTPVIDMGGRMILPGFHDGHAHPMSGAIRLLRCSFAAARSASRLSAAVRACAAAKPRATWLTGYGWHPETWPWNSSARQILDRLVPDRPAYLSTEDGFTAWVNSRALAAAGIDPETTEPEMDGLVRDSVTRRPTGIVKGEANGRIRIHRPRPTEGEYREALRRWTGMANRFGVTSVFDASVSEDMLKAYQAADAAGELKLRVVAAQAIDPSRGPKQVDTLMEHRDRAAGKYLRADAAKIFLDGGIEQHTAALLAPYADRPNSRGELLVQSDVLDALVKRLDGEGFLIHIHVMGDRAVRLALDAIAQAAQVNGPRDRRHQLAHVALVDPADIPRFARLGVAANLQPMWFQADDAALAQTETAVGPQRSRWLFPMRSIASGGANVVAGSDWPAASMNPLDSIEVAITRQPLGRSKPARQPQESIDLETILAAYTRNAAWVARENGIDGSLEVGKAADLIALDRNLFRMRPADLHKARVLLTLLDGKPVYRDPHFPWPKQAIGNGQ